MHTCILHTENPKDNLKYFYCGRKVVKKDSGIQSSQRYINAFSIKKIEEPLCKKLVINNSAHVIECISFI